jgi:hypothetical protein
MLPIPIPTGIHRKYRCIETDLGLEHFIFVCASAQITGLSLTDVHRFQIALCYRSFYSSSAGKDVACDVTLLQIGISVL